MLEDSREDATLLIERLEEDDLSAFNLLYERYRKALFIFALRFIKDEEVCYELVHDAFIYLWEKRMSAVRDRNISNYLYHFVRSRSLNYLRDQSHKRTVDLNRIMDSADHPTYELELGIPPNFISEALACISSPACRQIFEMRYLNELSYNEIAQKKGISINTVYVHMNNGLKLIREKLKNSAKD